MTGPARDSAPKPGSFLRAWGPLCSGHWRASLWTGTVKGTQESPAESLDPCGSWDMRAPSESPPNRPTQRRASEKGTQRCRPRPSHPSCATPPCSDMGPHSSPHCYPPGRGELGASRHQSPFRVWQVPSLPCRLTQEPRHPDESDMGRRQAGLAREARNPTMRTKENAAFSSKRDPHFTSNTATSVPCLRFPLKSSSPDTRPAPTSFAC